MEARWSSVALSSPLIGLVHNIDLTNDMNHFADIGNSSLLLLRYSTRWIMVALITADTLRRGTPISSPLRIKLQ